MSVSVVPRASSWSVERFSVRAGGDGVAHVEALRLRQSLLVRVSLVGGAGRLGVLALAAGDVATVALGGGDSSLADSLSRRLATSLQTPVWVAAAGDVPPHLAPVLQIAICNHIKKLL